jgi:hypothetical protein
MADKEEYVIKYMVNGKEPELPNDVCAAFRKNSIDPNLVFVLEKGGRFTPYAVSGALNKGQEPDLFSIQPSGTCPPGKSEFCIRIPLPGGGVWIICWCT